MSTNSTSNEQKNIEKDYKKYFKQSVIAVLIVITVAFGIYAFKDKILNTGTYKPTADSIEQANFNSKQDETLKLSKSPQDDTNINQAKSDNQDKNPDKIDSSSNLVSQNYVSVFEGKIGDYPVRMKISNKNGNIKGDYAYIKNNDVSEANLMLEGVLKDQKLDLVEKYMGKVTGQFSGKLETGKIIGEWKNESKKLNFSLNEIFNFSQKELESGFDKNCVPTEEDLKDIYGQDYSVEIENVVFSKKTNSYYFTAAQFRGPCNGNVNGAWLLYKTQTGTKDLKYITGSPEGMSTGGIISLSPEGNFLSVSRWTHGGYCSNYNDFEILDLLNNNKSVFESASKVDMSKIKGSFAQNVRTWVSNNEIEYEEYTNECTTDPSKPIEKTEVKRVKF